jgi:Acetyltransferase (GNAT) family
MYFGNEADLAELRRWRSVARFRNNPHVHDALEYAKLASKQWAYYNRNGETATSLQRLRAGIRRNPSAEIAIVLIARASWHTGGNPVGVAYCRRTWCHHLVVDFVAVHPDIVGQIHGRIRGIGTGLFYGLIQIADNLGIKTIWGEATVNSAKFYEKILGAARILDNFFITGETMDHCRNQLSGIHHRRA